MALALLDAEAIDGSSFILTSPPVSSYGAVWPTAGHAPPR
jgi:hypothetical protein